MPSAAERLGIIEEKLSSIEKRLESIETFIQDQNLKFTENEKKWAGQDVRNTILACIGGTALVSVVGLIISKLFGG